MMDEPEAKKLRDELQRQSDKYHKIQIWVAVAVFGVVIVIILLALWTVVHFVVKLW